MSTRQTRPGGSATVGGPEVARVIKGVRMPAQVPRPTALLLVVEEPGVGKEVAARVPFGAVAKRLLRALVEEKDATQRSVVLGPRFVAFNCAALTENQSASETFWVGAGVAARRGQFLEAGDDVVLLDEIEGMPTGDQAALLRLLRPPHRGTLVGTPTAIPVNAMMVACTNVQPIRLVAEERLRSDLFA